MAKHDWCLCSALKYSSLPGGAQQALVTIYARWLPPERPWLTAVSSDHPQPQIHPLPQKGRVWLMDLANINVFSQFSWAV